MLKLPCFKLPAILKRNGAVLYQGKPRAGGHAWVDAGNLTGDVEQSCALRPVVHTRGCGGIVACVPIDRGNGRFYEQRANDGTFKTWFSQPDVTIQNTIRQVLGRAWMGFVRIRSLTVTK